MLGSTVPDPMAVKRAKLDWAIRYTEMGWKVFVLGRDKTPLPNCTECPSHDWSHDRENCGHPTCHGFYAATNDLWILEQLFVHYPDGWMAVRTGRASNLVVLDFEAAPDVEGRFGSPEEFELWTKVELPDTQQQRTQSGGLHLLYKMSDEFIKSNNIVPSRNRVLPQTDVKAEGGYIVVPTPGRPERAWMGRSHPTVLTSELLNWLMTSRRVRSQKNDGSSTSAVSVDGYDFDRFRREGCPGGARDQFFNELIFRARKDGRGRHETEAVALNHWQRCAQPPDAEWFMPWEHVLYKLERVWQTVEPPEPMPSWRPVENIVGKTDEGKTIVKQGNVTVVRSEW